MPSDKKLGVLVVLALTALAIASYLAMHRHTRRPEAAAPTLPAAPALSLTDVNGSVIHTSDLKGKVVLVNFWAAWCTPCAAEVPQFVALENKYHAQGLQVIGFSVEDDAADLRTFYRKHQMNYPVVPSDLKIADAYGGVLGLPTTFVIGRDNRIHAKYNGSTDFTLIERDLLALLHAPQ